MGALRVLHWVIPHLGTISFLRKEGDLEGQRLYNRNRYGEALPSLPVSENKGRPACDLQAD